METLTHEQQDANRRDRLAEKGTEAKCPFCHKARVRRSSYIRCLPCGINWSDEEMGLPNYLDLDPRVARARGVHMATAMRATAGTSGADVD